MAIQPCDLFKFCRQFELNSLRFGLVAIFSFYIKRNLNPVSSILVRDIKQCINKENISFLYIMTFLYIRM